MTQPAGWYDDPQNPDNLRYWDGVIWTSHTTTKKSPTAGQSTIGHAVDVPSRHTGTAPEATPSPPEATQGTPSPAPGEAGGHGGHPQAGWSGGSYGQAPAGPGYGAAGPVAGWALGGKTTPDGARLADWGIRVGARLIDLVITGMIGGILAGWFWVQFIRWYVGYLGELTGSAGGAPGQPDLGTIQTEMLKYVIPITAISLVATVAYETFFLTRTGATPGKRICGISVRLRERPGPLSVADALRRQLIQIGATLGSLLPLVSLLASIASIVDYLWPLWDDKNQALHDKVARTNVVVGRQPRS